jgi:hypothetical protein
MKFLLLIALILPVSAFSQAKLVTIDGTDLSYVGLLAFKHDNAKSGSDTDTNTFKIHLNYAQALESNEKLMLRGAVKYSRENVDQQGPDSTNSTMGIGAGAIFNLEDEIKDSMFISGLLGMEYQVIDQAGEDESGTNFTIEAEFGKRWSMGQYSAANISYAPTFGILLRRYGGDIRKELYTNGREIKFNFLKFDIFF